MKRAIFDVINSNPKGKVFIANLYQSTKIGAVDKRALAFFIKKINEHTASPTSEEWWREYLPEQITSTLIVDSTKPNKICSITSIDEDTVNKIFRYLKRNIAEFKIGDTIPNNIITKTILDRRLNKKTYWVTEEEFLKNYTENADRIRDGLGLDFCHNNRYLFMVSIDFLSAKKSDLFKRPCGLSGGSPKFRARRDDEENHASYEGWGMTLDLAKWREKNGIEHSMAGCPEAIIDGNHCRSENFDKLVYMGKTEQPSNCDDKNDHIAYANFLLTHSPPADQILKELNQYANSQAA